ncbi:MAG: methyltransferase [Armatimonadetes bacterium]|nr:methyltransferase [Armatimonadota bacterium]
MTSRDRVLAALDHRQPDRVPIDLGGTFVTGIAAVALDRLRRRLGLDDHPVKIYDVYQMLGEVELDLVERCGVDCLPVEPLALSMGLRRERWQPWRLMDGTEVLMPGDFDVEVGAGGDWLWYAGNDRSRPPCCRMPAGGWYFDTIGYGDFHPDWEPPDLARLEEDSAGWLVTDAELAYLAGHARLLRRETDKCLVLGAWPWLGLRYVGTLTDFWCLLARDPGYVKELFALSTRVAVRNLERLWSALDTHVDVVTISGLDFGTQRAEWFRPEVFREVYLPGLREQFEWIHQHTPWRVFEHSCGSIANLLGDLVDAGLDALNPVQTSAAGMAPGRLKALYGDRLTFWGGGVETQTTLEFGTPAEVRAEVSERVRVLGAGGGLVFCPIHNIQPNTPPENVIAAYEAALGG